MSKISKRLPLAALAVAMLALFVALGASAIGAGGGGKADPGATAQSSRVAILTTAVSGNFTVNPGTQRTNLIVRCPTTHPQVTGGGVFSFGGAATSVNTSFPTVSGGRQAWRIDYNNLSSSPTTVRVYARCLRNV